MGNALFLLRFVTVDTFVHFWGGVRPEGSEGGVSGLPVRFACRTGRFRGGRKAKAGGAGKPAASRVPAGCLVGGWMVRKV